MVRLSPSGFPGIEQAGSEFKRLVRRDAGNADGLTLEGGAVIEAELKARVRDPGGVRARLAARAALEVSRRVLGDLGITEDDLTTELYTDMVAEHRRAVAPPA
jgi:hypothetical protein